MSEKNEACMVAFDVLGVGAVVTTESPEVAERVREELPQGALERDPQPGDAEFAIDVPHGDAAGAAFVHLRNELIRHLALHAPDHVFLRAGVVAIGGRAILQLQGPQGPLIAPYLAELGYEHNIPSGSAQQRTVEVAARWPGYPPEAPGGRR